MASGPHSRSTTAGSRRSMRDVETCWSPAPDLRIDDGSFAALRNPLAGQRQNRVAALHHPLDLSDSDEPAGAFLYLFDVELLDALEQRLRESRQLVRVFQLAIRAERPRVIDQPDVEVLRHQQVVHV